jgi:hypothetical protein
VRRCVIAAIATDHCWETHNRSHAHTPRILADAMASLSQRGRRLFADAGGITSRTYEIQEWCRYARPEGTTNG